MSMLVPDITIAEKVMRSVSVYLFRLVAFHVAPKRPLGQLAALYLVVLLGINNVLPNAAIGSDSPPGAGWSAPPSSSRSTGWWRGSPSTTSESASRR
jgi:hypothetical protein